MAERVVRLSARDNPLLVRIRKLVATPAAYRRAGQVWLEGEHLLQAALTRGLVLDTVVMPESRAEDASLTALHREAGRVVIVSEARWRELGALDSPSAIAALLPWPAAAAIDPVANTVVLDRVQDAGNVGSILRSAAALGVSQIIALAGTAALWSPKLLRAAMGAHFGLTLVESAAVADLAQLRVPLLGTSSHSGTALHRSQLTQPQAWIFSHEGQGISAELLARCATTVSIPQPGGEESLNVAAAAAICLYEALRQRLV